MTPGFFLAYMLQSALFLAAGYAAYKLFLSKVKMPAFNRAVILTIYVSAIVAPAFTQHADTSSPAASADRFMQSAEMHISISAESDNNVTSTVPDAYDGHASDAIPVASVNTPEQPEQNIEEAGYHRNTYATASRVACVLALAGGVAMTLRLLYGMITVIGMHRQGESRRMGGIRLVLLDNNINPFSLLNLIFITRRDYNNGCDMIIRHELGHIRNLHCLDLLLSKLCLAAMWWNPAAWLLNRELRAVHEYQADDNVMRAGHDVKEYQMLLIRKAATRARISTIASSLNHSKLKQRFTMMYKTRPSRWAHLRATTLIPAFCGVAMLAGQQTFATMLNDISAATLESGIKTGATDNDFSEIADGNGRYLSLTLPATTIVGDRKPSEMAMANPEPAPEPGSKKSENNKNATTPSHKSVWELEVLKSNPKYINVMVFDEEAGSPTINGQPVTFDQMEEYLRDTGNSSHIEHLNKMRQIHKRTKQTENADWQRFVRADDADDAIITVINAGQNQTVYITPQNTTQQKNSTTAHQQPDTGQARIMQIEAQAQAMETRAQAYESRAQAETKHKAAASARKNAAKLRKDAKKLRQQAAKERKKLKKAHAASNKTDFASGKSDAQTGQGLDSLETLATLNELDSKMVQLDQALEEVEKKLQALSNTLGNIPTTDSSNHENTQTPVTEKLSAKFIRLDNTDGTNVQVMITSTTPVHIGGATMKVNGKLYNCSAKKSAEIYQHSENRYETIVKVHTRKLTEFTNHDYVSIITDRGTVNVKFRYH